MNGWLLFPSALAAIAIGGGILNIVFNCIDYFHAHRREAAFPDGERGD